MLFIYLAAPGCFYDGECDDNRIEYVADPATSVNFNVDNLKVTFSTKFFDIFVCSYHINNSEIQYQDKIKYNFRTKRTIVYLELLIFGTKCDVIYAT